MADLVVDILCSAQTPKYPSCHKATESPSCVKLVKSCPGGHTEVSGLPSRSRLACPICEPAGAPLPRRCRSRAVLEGPLFAAPPLRGSRPDPRLGMSPALPLLCSCYLVGSSSPGGHHPRAVSPECFWKPDPGAAVPENPPGGRLRVWSPDAADGTSVSQGTLSQCESSEQSQPVTRQQHPQISERSSVLQLLSRLPSAQNCTDVASAWVNM